MEDQVSQLKLYSLLYVSSKRITNERLDKLKRTMKN